MVSAFTGQHRGGTGTPLLLLHGFLDTWRTWELTLPALERSHDVLAPTLAGHAGGPPLGDGSPAEAIVDAVEQLLDEAGWATVHVAGNSLGGWVALKLAERGRARSLVAFAPAGGTSDAAAVLALNEQARAAAAAAVPHVDALVTTKAGRRSLTRVMTVRYEHLPPELIADVARGAAAAPEADRMLAAARGGGWPLDPAKVDCPVRFVWGLEDALLPWPAAAETYLRSFPAADWVELEGVGHAPQLDVPLEAAQLVLGWAAR